MRRLPGVPALTSLAIAAVACAAVAITATSRSRRPPSLAEASRASDTPVVDHVPGGGPDGGAVTSIAAAGARSTVVFAAFDRGGVLKSADRGVSWTPADRGLPAGDSCDLVAVAMSNTLFAACGDGLFMTTSAGALWRQLDLTDAMPPLVAPSDPRVVYQPIVSRTILRSRDGGRRWESRVSEDPGCHSGAAIDPADPFVLYCAGGERLRVSRDGGVSWTSSASAWPAGADITALAPHPFDRNTIVASTNRGRVLQTRTGGASWEEIGSTPEHVDFDRLEFVGDGAVLFASHWTGILRSLDGGRQWQTLLESPDLPLLGAAFAVDPRSPSTIYAATRRGVLVTTDGGGRWTLRERGVRRASASVAVHGGAVAMLYASNGRDLFASTNDGDSWSVSRVGGDPARIVTSVAADGAGGVLAHTSGGAFQLRSGQSTWTTLDSFTAFSSAPQRLPGAAIVRPVAAGFEYSNDGREWRRASLPGNRTPTSVVTFAGELVFASTGGPLGGLLGQNGIWRSRDAGASWLLVDEPRHGGGARCCTLTSDGSGGNAVYAVVQGVGIGGEGDVVRRSLDGGETFTELPIPGLASFFTVVPTSPPTLMMQVSDSRKVGRLPIFASYDRGDTWIAIGAGLPAGATINNIAFDPREPGRLFAGTDGRGVYRSSDAGVTWRPTGATR